MSAPESFVGHLQKEGYHPRSNKHSNALCLSILDDILERCSRLAEHAAAGRLVYKLNHTVKVGHADWNIDLLLGEPPRPLTVRERPVPIEEMVPSTIRVALEAKAIMTEHKKAQRNRIRDLGSFHQYAYSHDPYVVSAAVTVINISPTFRSPLRREVTEHRNPEKLVADAIGLLRTLPPRAQVGDASGLEANAVIVVSHDNVGGKARLWNRAPAPQPGDPLHYDTFVQRICQRYEQRW